MPDTPLVIDPGLVKNLFEFPDVCPTSVSLVIPEYPVTVSKTNVGLETRNKESGSFDLRAGALISMRFEFIALGELSSIIHFWQKHQGRLMTFQLPIAHCLRRTIGLESTLWELYPFWRFETTDINCNFDADRIPVNFEVSIRNVNR